MVETPREPDPIPKQLPIPAVGIAGALEAIDSARQATAAVAAAAVAADPIPVKRER